MEVTPENDPLKAYGYDEMMTVEDVMDLFDCSDGTARDYLKEIGCYLLIKGVARCPRYGLAKAIYEDGATPGESDDQDDDVIEFDEARTGT